MLRFSFMLVVFAGVMLASTGISCHHVCLCEVDLVGLKPILRNTTSFSALTLLVGSFDPQKPSPK